VIISEWMVRLFFSLLFLLLRRLCSPCYPHQPSCIHRVTPTTSYMEERTISFNSTQLTAMLSLTRGPFICAYLFD
jgi:hypothetical protein